jgi:tRNA A-37 threonylcarbamoyl transferase component Bud32
MDATAASARPGRPLAIAKYEVTGEIGHGGMATVYRARDPRLGRDVALKVIHPHLRESREVKARFFVEAQAVAKLRHPNIVEVYDVAAENEPEQYLVVELLEGVTLRKLLQDHGPLLPELAAAIILEILAALAHAHASGVVHRDVKPENVMVEHRPKGGNEDAAPGQRVVVKLMDFGIAKLLDAQGVTSTGQVLGSPAHMAPEQIEGGDVDARADVFSVGVLFYECIVGTLPFEGNNPAQVLRKVLDGLYTTAERANPKVGAAWSRILQTALARKPEDRFPTAMAFRDAICQELTRLEVKDARAELERFLDEGPSFREAFEARLVQGLADRADRALAKSDTLAAAADYNRALAYAPADPRLLRAVAGMHRAVRRSRLLRSGAASVGAAVLLLLLVVGIYRIVARRAQLARDDRRTTTVTAGPNLAPGGVAAPQEDAAVAGASTARAASPARSAPTAGPVPAPLPRNPGILAPVPRAALRDVVVTSVRPLFGVEVRVDGEAPQEVTAGLKISLDGRAHGLRFTCVNDACEPLEKAVPAGERDERMDVALGIRPASLLVDGDRSLNYQVAEEPAIVVRPGMPVRVPMRGSKMRITVIELPSGRTRSVALTAGKDARVSFAETP